MKKIEVTIVIETDNLEQTKKACETYLAATLDAYFVGSNEKIVDILIK